VVQQVLLLLLLPAQLHCNSGQSDQHHTCALGEDT
jgi:hypothetical protein